MLCLLYENVLSCFDVLGGLDHDAQRFCAQSASCVETSGRSLRISNENDPATSRREQTVGDEKKEQAAVPSLLPCWECGSAFPGEDRRTCSSIGRTVLSDGQE